MARPRLTRRRRVYLLLAFLSGLGAIQELGFRMAFPLPEVPAFNRIHYTPLDYFDERFKKAQESGLNNVLCRWESEVDGFCFDHALNLYGFRGPDILLSPPRDCERVLFVGDSFVEGFGASDQDTIPQQFAHRVATRRPVEAINLGVGASAFLGYCAVVRDGLRVFGQSRAVFLVVCYNDLPAPRYQVEFEAPGSEFTPRNPYVPHIVQLFRRLFQGQVIPRWYHTGPIPFLEPVPAVTNPLSRLPPPPDIDPVILDAMRRGKVNPYLAGSAELMETMLRTDLTGEIGATGYLRWIAALCRKHQAQLIVVYIPWHAVINADYLAAQNRLGGRLVASLDGPEYRNQQQHLRRVTEALRIPLLDTTTAFLRAEQGGDRLFWPVDGHCNAEGYKLVADVCATYWIKNRMPEPFE